MDVDAVTTLLEEAGQTLILPRFRRLASHEIEAKSDDPADIVTIVDREVEARLTSALAALDPAAAVVGEEAAHRDPAVLQRVAGDEPLWVLDPIDGTRNFAAGLDSFGVMLSWVVRGRALAAWVLLPARGQVFVAEAGSGAFLNGGRIHVPSPGGSRPRGTVLGGYMPADIRERIVTSLAGRYDTIEPSWCAAIDYTDILHGRRDFAVYYRLLPWDHGAPALLLTEAGGRVSHLDGREYSVRSGHQPAIVAREAGLAEELRAWIEEGPALL